MSTSCANFAHFFDYLRAARGRWRKWVRTQPSGVYTQTFPIGLRSIRATLVHTAMLRQAGVAAENLDCSRLLRERTPINAPCGHESPPHADRRRGGRPGTGGPHPEASVRSRS